MPVSDINGRNAVELSWIVFICWVDVKLFHREIWHEPSLPFQHTSYNAVLLSLAKHQKPLLWHLFLNPCPCGEIYRICKYSGKYQCKVDSVFWAFHRIFIFEHRNSSPDFGVKDYIPECNSHPFECSSIRKGHDTVPHIAAENINLVLR